MNPVQGRVRAKLLFTCQWVAAVFQKVRCCCESQWAAVCGSTAYITALKCSSELQDRLRAKLCFSWVVGVTSAPIAISGTHAIIGALLTEPDPVFGRAMALQSYYGVQTSGSLKQVAGCLWASIPGPASMLGIPDTRGFLKWA